MTSASTDAGADAGGEFITMAGARWARIEAVDEMPPFFMSIVSDSDVWLFVGSNGPFTAGRVHTDQAMFPYQTVDKILRDVNSSGARTAMLVSRGAGWLPWEPWQGLADHDGVRRNLYKRVDGTGVLFEEVHPSLGLRFRWELAVSERYGLVRTSTIDELSGQAAHVRYLDGYQHIIPPGLGQELYARYSYLALGYMRHERLDDTLALYTLNTTITDRPEPAESLRASVAWSLGHRDPSILIDGRAIEAFRRGERPAELVEARGRMGAYLAMDEVKLGAGGSHRWYTVADTGADHRTVLELRHALRSPDALRADLEASVQAGRDGLHRRVAEADGVEVSADEAATANHFANVVFNIMRGGTFERGDQVPGADVSSYLLDQSPQVHRRHHAWLASLPTWLPLGELQATAGATDDPQLRRLLWSYLPITFSRRHGDPSRPWNRFSIRVRDDEGEPIYGYEGNWRDIFQNWEALAQSYPGFLPHFVSVFLNASTADGYNPYRVTRAGIDWEVVDPDDPWSHIGYWGDHQIVYLHRLLDAWERHAPGDIRARLDERSFAYADVPYRIAGFEAILRDPLHTIDFDQQRHERALADVTRTGADGKLLHDDAGEVRLATLAEKLLLPLLAKLTNLVPGSGIWLTTQRPEWNDANNALAGWGVSLVTLNAISGYVRFLDRILPAEGAVLVSAPSARLLHALVEVLGSWPGTFDQRTRLSTLRDLGTAGETHRQAVYAGEFGTDEAVELSTIRTLLEAVSTVCAETIRTSRRPDGLYHAYDRLEIDDHGARIAHLEPMLEGQVAVLASGSLGDDEAVELLSALRTSDLYRPDQHSYLLYPDRASVPYLERNTLPGSPPLEDPSLFVVDRDGAWHFQADLQTVADVEARLEALGASPEVRGEVLRTWRAVFDHAGFTGRSGRFFMFEGLGSIYWHMVAKLLLAVQEQFQRATDAASAAALADRYHDIRDGLGFRKSPAVHGAFPTDPYSHTPAHLGAQQPGMTGQVKEQILTRFGELGIEVLDGAIHIDPRLLPLHELDDGRVEFSLCALPFVLRGGSERSVVVIDQDDRRLAMPDMLIESAVSADIFARRGRYRRVEVTVPRDALYVSSEMRPTP